MADNLSSEIVKQSIDKASLFLGKLVNKPLEELGGLWADNIRLYRFKNQVNILLKAQKYLESKSIVPATISLKTLAPLLEYSSWEEDNNMQEKWASLLANAANPSVDHDNEQSYVEIFNQLSPLQASILDLVYKDYLENLHNVTRRGHHYTKEKLIELLPLYKSEKLDISLENLYRLNLLNQPFGTTSAGMPFNKGLAPVAVQTTEVFRMSLLGIDFMKHCIFD